MPYLRHMCTRTRILHRHAAVSGAALQPVGQIARYSDQLVQIVQTKSEIELCIVAHFEHTVNVVHNTSWWMMLLHLESVELARGFISIWFQSKACLGVT